MVKGFEEELAKTNSVVHQMQNIYSVGGAAEFSYGDMLCLQKQKILLIYLALVIIK